MSSDLPRASLDSDSCFAAPGSGYRIRASLSSSPLIRQRLNDVNIQLEWWIPVGIRNIVVDINLS